MKKLLILVAACAALVTSAFAQSTDVVSRWDRKPAVSASSTYFNFNFDRIDVAYLHDGLNESYMGLYTPFWYFPRTGIEVGPLVSRATDNTETNVGLFLVKSLYSKDGFDFKLGAGIKGFNLDDSLSFQSGSQGYMIGAFVTIKM